MALFTVGKRYQGNYTVEHNVPFFDGELAIANYLDERYYLQAAPLVQEFTTLEFNRFKRLYDELDFDLLLPVSEMFSEGTQVVFVYPYQPIQPLRDIVLDTGVEDDQLLNWLHQVIQTEIALQSMGIPMYIIRDPRNIGLTREGELRVIFSGIEDVTYYQSTLNWGTFLYCIASGEYLEESLKKLPPKHALSKPVAKVIQKCLRAKDLQSMLSVIEQSIKKIEGKGLISSLFGRKKKKEDQTPQNQQIEATETLNDLHPSSTEAKQEEPSAGQATNSSPVEENFYASPNMDPQQTAKLEKDPFDWKDEDASSSQNTQQPIDPFEQQLEQMYQSIEQEQKEQQKGNQQEETQFFTTQEQENPNDQFLDQTMIFHPNQELDSQMSTSEESKNQIHSVSHQSSDPTSDQSSEQKIESGGFTRKSSTDMDETQIFSASDLSSLEEELKLMQEDQLQMKKQELEQPKDSKDPQFAPTIETKQPSEDDDQMKQLESLFGELEQLQQQDQQSATVIPEMGAEEKPISTQSVGTMETNETSNTTSTVSNLDAKVQELESLFDEINQLQAKEQEMTSTKMESSQVQDEKPVKEVSEKEVPDKEEQGQKKEVQEEEKVEISEVAEGTPVEKAAATKKKEEPKPEPVDPLEKLRLQFEQEQQALIEEQRKKFEERKQALIDQAQEEMKKRQQQLLSEIEQQEEQILDQLQKDLKLQEEEQLKLEREAKKRLKVEYEKRKREEMRKLELDNLEKKHEKEVKAGLHEIEQEFAQKQKQQIEELEEEYAKKKQAVVDQLKEERKEAEKAFKEKKQQEWELIVKDYEGDEDETDQDSGTKKGADSQKDDLLEESHQSKERETRDDSKEEVSEQNGQEKSKKKKQKENKNEREKKRLKKRRAEEEKKKHDDLASQFDEHKQELLAGSSNDDNSTVNENRAN